MVEENVSREVARCKLELQSILKKYNCRLFGEPKITLIDGNIKVLAEVKLAPIVVLDEEKKEEVEYLN